ncbi:MAG TPA: hypothetical protein VFX96_16545, partial [Pyrinomonadaceae bacterium]|nr:hypothetical protein [Pyrinomonadaceae bacterium]
MRLRTTTLSLALAFCLLPALAPSAADAQRRRTVSLLLVNGKIFTADERGTVAQAVAIEGSRIVAVGTTRGLR